MLRIAITQVACGAICATLLLGSVGLGLVAQRWGERYVWIEDAMADRLIPFPRRSMARGNDDSLAA
jgi:hypothetical protein